MRRNYSSIVQSFQESQKLNTQNMKESKVIRDALYNNGIIVLCELKINGYQL